MSNGNGRYAIVANATGTVQNVILTNDPNHPVRPTQTLVPEAGSGCGPGWHYDFATKVFTPPPPSPPQPYIAPSLGDLKVATDDASAAAAGVQVNGLYRNGIIVQIRIV